MGVHFTVTVDHDLIDTELCIVRHRLASLEPAFAEIAPLSDWARDDWRDVTEPGRSRPEHFYAPAGFDVIIGAAALRFHHGTRFGEFVDGGGKTDLLRRFSRQLATAFGQHRALYAPCEGIGDEIVDWITEGLSLADIEGRLRPRSNPPATIEELAGRSFPELRYFVEEFGAMADENSD